MRKLLFCLLYPIFAYKYIDIISNPYFPIQGNKGAILLLFWIFLSIYWILVCFFSIKSFIIHIFRLY